ncbi:cation diffusion facilitator family transporter [Paraburkholderia sp. CNPSo 3272]|uniref:cation diffusion facilitator family transporter n=1 Tax=Paraburkholderia sp. CNPSo 3272 TaxID=2940931 RepID=UPI0020B6FCEC|nr:cation diffusion facilitator family transporter [Paraburkholderia sp. CNPSo 3272]MCP3723158.1 cation diffusion facilitator family transporter [Paraburkholderia sp. CNPSo 3272]
MPISYALRKARLAAVEQRTMKVSIYVVCLGFAANVGYGFLVQSDTLLLTAIFYLLNLVSSALGLLVATVVSRPATTRFEYGYWFLEPLVNGINGLMMLLVCVYGFVNGIEGIRSGGHVVNAQGVMLISAASCVISFAMVIYKKRAAAQINSKLLKTDGWKWIMKFSFSAATLLGFFVYSILPESFHYLWARYVDSAMTAGLSLIFLFAPVKIVSTSFAELLHMSPEENNPRSEIEMALSKLERELGILRSHTHVIQAGRRNFVEVSVLVGATSTLSDLASQDELRERIWETLRANPLESRLIVQITADPRWEDGRQPG